MRPPRFRRYTIDEVENAAVVVTLVIVAIMTLTGLLA